MVSRNSARLGCAYAFDPYRNIGRMEFCNATAVRGKVDRHVMLRRRVLQSHCQRRNNLMHGLSVQAMDTNINCCWLKMADALDAQRKYALLPHASACERTNLLNQMMISWTPSEIIGVFYVKDEEKKFAHRMLRITEAQRSNWVERQAKALATRTLRSPVAAPWTPSLPRHPLQLCQLPTPATQWWFAINRTKAGRGVEARGRALGGPVDDIQRSTASSPNAA
mmetsp:Transcript_20386/g.62104  ORF Transcript_20386/g.62104 Transcript_20386/m.62104 type:complete len:223 (+) Transcript_20386:550-1218(+)